MQEKDRKILEKIKKKPYNTAKGISDDTKSRIYICLNSKGMSNATINRRMFLVGFKEWELMGIDNVVGSFAQMKDMPQLTAENILDTLKEKRGLREHFYTYMTSRGMSRITCIKRFGNSQWLPWERVGISSVLDEIIN